MDKIVEAILKVIPFSKLFERIGFSKEVSASLSIIVVAFLLYTIVRVTNYITKKIKNRKTAIEDIRPQFDHLSVKKARQFFIPTQYQNASPARQEEPGFTHNYVARNKLIPFFLKIAFNEKISSDRFYLILADSGMGKTTFMINLFFAYHSFRYHRAKYSMKMFRFSNPDTINQVKSIRAEEAKKTILLLDALDEDLGIISKNPKISDAEAFQNRVDEIIEITKNFYQLIITCRTQYFPGQEDDPYELKVRRPDEKGFYTLNKIYISPFNEKEVKKYLNKKFGNVPFINQKKKKRSLRIVSQSRNLVMRPMLLSYIDYLIEEEVTDNSAYSIYDTLVSKWLQRESEKRKGINDRKNFIESLRKLSYKTAIVIYLNWKKEGRMYVTKEEALSIAGRYKIELRPEEITGQSLLTCDGAANWKFAHKSILEFFLANEAYNNPKFLKDMNFKGMDMARKFYEDLNPKLMLIDHRENYSSSNRTKKPNDFYIYNQPVTIKEFHEILGSGSGGDPDTYDSSDFYTCSFKKALMFCNFLNSNYNYPPVYDENYNLLDPNGNIVKTVSKVKGFRLPSREEWQYLYSPDAFLPRYHGPSNKALTISLEVAKITAKGTRILFDSSREKNTKTELYKEWCYDENGISVAPFYLDRYLSEMTVGEYQQYMKSEQKNYISVEDAESKQHRFRVVFIP